MTDSINKKVTIPLHRLKIVARQVGATTVAEYVTRYRVTSEDKNTYSEWSPLYKIQMPSVSQILAAANDGTVPTITPKYSSSAGVATVVWDVPNGLKDVVEYDLYAKYGSGSYTYVKTVGKDRFDYIKPTGQTATSVSLLLQLKTYPQYTVTSLKVFELLNQSI